MCAEYFFKCVISDTESKDKLVQKISTLVNTTQNYFQPVMEICEEMEVRDCTVLCTYSILWTLKLVLIQYFRH